MILDRYREARRERQIDEELNDALYQAAALCAFEPMERVVSELARGHGPLSREFATADKEIRGGAAPDRALSRLASHTRSAVLKRAVGFLILAYRTGADISGALQEIAEDAAETADAVRQRAAVLTVQKLTMLAGAFILPVVLGIAYTLASGLDTGSLSELGLGGTGPAPLAAILAGDHVYLAAYSVIASVAVAMQEGSREKALVYAAVLLPASQLLFLLVRSLPLF
jgi:pilus assembly protein TadC